ncbi:MAG TPA: hypothetical protein VGQ83_10495 [Polyangia bacterium]
MTALVRPPTEALRARLRDRADRRLSDEEIEARLARPPTEAEREEMRALIAWFRRRYPTPAARLAYCRRAYARWTRSAAAH